MPVFYCFFAIVSSFSDSVYMVYTVYLVYEITDKAHKYHNQYLLSIRHGVPVVFLVSGYLMFMR